MADVEKKESKGILTKVIAGVFTAVVAPVLVAVGVKWLDPSKWTSAPATQPGQVAKGSGHEHGRVHFGASPRLADHFVSYGFSEEQEMPVRSRDGVDAKMFHAADKNGGIHVPGGLSGSLVSNQDYDNYVLTLAYQWGKTRMPQMAPRTAAVRVHVSGADPKHPDGAMGIAVLLDEGNTGAVRLLGEKTQALCHCKDVPVANNRFCRVYDPAAPEKSVVRNKPMGWDGTVCRFGAPTLADPPARTDGWNQMIITCQGDTLSVKVNGQETCKLTRLNLVKGRIVLTSQKAEITYRQMDLEPIAR